MKNKKRILTLVLALSLVAALLVGCGAPQAATPEQEHVHQPEAQVLEVSPLGGVLCLKINPEIALHYDANGKVTRLEGRNWDGTQILEGYTGFEGKDTSVVLSELVNRIGQAGYLVEEAEGEGRKIVLELDPGSNVPHDAFLADMASHVKKTIETKSWIGETEYEYNEPTTPPAQPPKAPAATPSAAKPAAPSPSTSTVPAGLCPICADNDCNDGAYCDDADDKAENLREYEAWQKAKEQKQPSSSTTSSSQSSTKETAPKTLCPTCADDDCDDGAYCDDADDKAENLREYEAKQKAKEQKKPEKPQETVPQNLCPVCADDDCDDGAYCDDADDKAENLREQAAKEAGKRCPVCRDYDCDDGQYCDDYDD